MAHFLLTQEEAMEMLGIGEKAFRAQGIPYVKIGKRRKYLANVIINHFEKLLQEPICSASPKGKARRSTNTASPSMGRGFEAAVKQRTQTSQQL